MLARLKEVYEDISGNYISDLTGAAKFPYYPDEYAIEPKFELDPNRIGDIYGTRWRAYLCPPYDGVYTFYISSDDHSELYLSPNQAEAAKSRIARATAGPAPVNGINILLTRNPPPST